MTVVARLKVGKTFVKAPRYPSEPGYVKSVNDAMKKIQADIQYIIDQFEDVTPDIMEEALQPTLELSKVYCPKDTGALVDSAYLEVSRYRGKPSVEIGYAKGNRPDYAAYVHEMVEIPHAAPTRAKFLEAAVNEDVGNIIERVDSAYRRFMGT